ncbi:MAG: class I SAM-dependent methyltransferase [Deltaproteobacteria bacterium]|nr:class I SAM-dependent methyltransferase [Deltaproteobacteria bacterium]
MTDAVHKSVISEVGCGTGLNFRYLWAAIGGTGRLVGIDLTDAMLEKGRARVQRNGWRNVEVVEIDAVDYLFPVEVQGAISTFALALVPEYQRVMDHAHQLLLPADDS